jgi:hypothetical protein
MFTHFSEVKLPPEVVSEYTTLEEEVEVKSTLPPLQTPAALAAAVGVGFAFTVAVIAVLTAGHPEEAA